MRLPPIVRSAPAEDYPGEESKTLEMYLVTEVEPEHGARSPAAKKERPSGEKEVLRLHVPAVRKVQEWSRVRGPVGRSTRVTSFSPKNPAPCS